MKSLVNYFLILLPGAVWGGSFVVTRLILPYLPPFSISFSRSLISAVFMLIMLRIAGGRLPRTLKEWLPMIGLAVLNTSAFLMTAWGQIYISSGLTTILAATIPLFTIVVAHFYTSDDKMHVMRVLGILMGLFGVVILVGNEALQSLGTAVFAQLAIVMASFLYGMSGNFARTVLNHESAELNPNQAHLKVMTMQFSASCILVLPLSLFFDRPWELEVPLKVLGYLAFLGIGVTTFASMVYYYLIQSLGSSLASMTMYIIPISGMALGVFFLGEVIIWTMPVALVLILGGVFVSNRRTIPKVAPT